jgi:iron complex outermembrane receptor protein
MSIEQLMNESVTSVSKKETKLSEAPTAITVITQEDIRRSGMTTLPELLRMVPGLDVARIDANEWAISSRGFNQEFGRKLLVLIDGRTVYTPVTASVSWNAQDVVLEDLDRIEVIRGPGATLWGANAVNGVINIVSKKAKDTQGVLISGAVGTEEQPLTTIRYGGKVGDDWYYRIFVDHYDRAGFVDPMGNSTPDDWHSTHTGFRTDWEPDASRILTLQGDYYIGEAGESVTIPSFTAPFSTTSNVKDQNAGGNILGRWEQNFSERSGISFQTYFDHVQQDNGLSREYRNTFDAELQHRFGLGSRNDIVWGTGARYSRVEDTSPTFAISWDRESRDLHLFNIFAQDEITIIPDEWRLTLGSKFEHNSFTGFEVQPSARLLWTPTKNQTVWAAVSRATRTPSVFERDLRFNEAVIPGAPGNPPNLISVFGNPNIDEEKLVAVELGYRIAPTARLSFDATAFANFYEDLVNYEPDPVTFENSPAPPHVLIGSTLQNSLKGETYGTELTANWQVTDSWRLTGSYSLLKMYMHPYNTLVEESPQQQVQIRSRLDLPWHLEFDAAAYYVDQINVPDGLGRADIGSYTRLDLGLAWHPKQNIEVGVWGQNLLDNQHPETVSVKTSLRTEVPRGVIGKLSVRF